MVDRQKLYFVQLFATQAHAGQIYGALPYTHHLQDVYRILLEFGCQDEDVLIASWLHDTIEDTNTRRKQLEEFFGKRVAALVWAVTDEADGRAAKVETYKKMVKEPGATGLKLGDRLANVRHGGSLVGMYKREQAGFKKALYREGQYEEMWAELDRLLEGWNE